MSNSIKLFFRESWLLIISAVFFGALLAITNAEWDPKIKANEVNKFNTLAKSLLPAGENFEPLTDTITLDLGGKTITADVRKGLDASGACVGWAFICEGGGFADKIKLVAAADTKFEKLLGFGVLSSNETPGFGDKINLTDGPFQPQFRGIPAAAMTLNKAGDPTKLDTEIIAITGATVTSQAVVNIFNQYLVPIKEQLSQKGLITQ